MYLLLAGIGLLIWNYNRIGFVADMSWWWALSPFALAVAWWTWADMTGYTKRKEMEKMGPEEAGPHRQAACCPGHPDPQALRQPRDRGGLDRFRSVAAG